MINLFALWNTLKQKLHKKKERKIHFRKGEIRWVSFGQNIQSETFGKGKSFRRPGLIIQTVFGHSAIIIPLTSAEKIGNYYFKFTDSNNENQIAILPQIKYIDGIRIGEKISSIQKKDFTLCKKQLFSIFE